MMMKTIAQELAPRGIRVNGLAPGATRTPINTAAWSTPERRRGPPAVRRWDRRPPLMPS